MNAIIRQPNLTPPMERLVRLGALSRFEQGLGQRLWRARGSSDCRCWPVLVNADCAMFANVLIDVCETPTAQLWRIAINRFGYGPLFDVMAEWLVTRGFTFCRARPPHVEVAQDAVRPRELTCTVEQLDRAALWAGVWARYGPDVWDDLARIEPPPFVLMAGRLVATPVTPERNADVFSGTAASYIWTKEARAFLGDDYHA
jgi:hypothetical protein